MPLDSQQLVVSFAFLSFVIVYGSSIRHFAVTCPSVHSSTIVFQCIHKKIDFENGSYLSLSFFFLIATEIAFFFFHSTCFLQSINSRVSEKLFSVFYTLARNTRYRLYRVPPTAITFIRCYPLSSRVAFDPSVRFFNEREYENGRGRDRATTTSSPSTSRPIILQSGRMGNWHVNANEIIHH